jgi:predicted nucleic acid-binding protein
MKYVLDACVGIKWVLPEPDSTKALALRDRFLDQIHELIARDTFPPEVAHALTRAERRGVITPEHGAREFANLLATLPAIHQSLPLLPRAYELSSQMRIGAFDCLYVALAEREQCEVVSADERLVRKFPATVVSLASFVPPTGLS